MRHCRCKTKFEAGLGEEGVLVTRRGLQVSPGQRHDVRAFERGERAAQASSANYIIKLWFWCAVMDLMVVWEAVGPAGRRAANRPPWSTAGQRPRIRSMEEVAGDERIHDCMATAAVVEVVVSSGPGRSAQFWTG
jgi:hypothetical protein